MFLYARLGEEFEGLLGALIVGGAAGPPRSCTSARTGARRSASVADRAGPEEKAVGVPLPEEVQVKANAKNAKDTPYGRSRRQAGKHFPSASSAVGISIASVDAKPTLGVES